MQKIQIYYRDYIVGVATGRAVDTMGSEDVYTPNSEKRPKGHEDIVAPINSIDVYTPVPLPFVNISPTD